MTAELPPAGGVVVVAAEPGAPGALGDLLTQVAAHPMQIGVLARYDQRGPARGPLVADILDALGRPGTHVSGRKHERNDLTLLVPYLLTADATDLVVAQALALGVEGCEDLLALASLCELRLWLCLEHTPARDFDELVAAHCTRRLSLREAAEALAAVPVPVPKERTDAHELGHRLAAGLTWTEDERKRIAGRLRATTDMSARAALHARHSRDTARAAGAALRSLPAFADLLVERLLVRDVADGGRRLLAEGRCIEVPEPAAAALLRQQLHALVVGQGADEPLFTIDGAPVSESGLAALLAG